jgi:hypothetical protein
MGLFDSGLRAPGGSYSFTFVGAASYQLVDSATQHRGTLKVAMTITPTTGCTGTTFTVTWASAGPPTNYVFDIQIRRPGSANFVDWLTGQTTAQAPFIPDTGQGSYAFKSRIRNSGNGKAAGYSPQKKITVNC